VCILDESDEMLSMGFLPQINEIQSYLPESHQTLLFSATLPADIQRLAETRLKNPVFLTLSGDHIGALEVQHLTYFSRRDKLEDLLRILEVEDPEGAIIFCNTKDETKRVAAALDKRSYRVEWLNADLAQSDREKVMELTRQGRLRFLVCTDVASRGIDISHLTHVINFDFPESPEAYVHRTGRTGRAGRTGTAISLITPGDIGYLYFLRLTYKIAPIERHLPSASELRTREQTDLVEMFVEAFGNRAPHADDVTLARRLISHEAAEIVLAGLLRDHLGTRPDASNTAAENRRSRKPQTSAEGIEFAKPSVSPASPAVAPRDEHSSVNPSGDATDPRKRRRRKRNGYDVRGDEELGPMPSPSEPEFEFKYTVESEEVNAAAAARREPEANSAVFAPKAETESLASSDEIAEIFVSLGRRDGVSAEDVMATLASRAISTATINHVSVRHHHTFVGVKRAQFNTVLEVLDGATIAGRLARAEPARSSRP
jgi:ATP-dependent RNA helicase DeaD